MCIGSSAQAQVSQVVRPFIGFTQSYDSNVLGLSSPEAALSTTGIRMMSDSSRTGYAGVDVEKPIGRQRVSANLMVSRTGFTRLSQLDYRGENFVADWNWRVGNDWSGKAGFVRTKSLAPFTDFHGLESNTNTTARRHVSAAWQFHPSWRLRAEAAHHEVDYSLASQSVYDRTERQSVFGIDYVTRAGNAAGLQWRRVDGHLPRQLIGPQAQPNDYLQDQLEFKANWQATGKTHVDFLGGMVRRQHAVYSERDFRGYNGRATLGMKVGSNTEITLAAWRETGIFDELSTAYSINRAVNIGVRWPVTNKTTLEGSSRREFRDFTRSLQFTSLPDYRDVLQMNQLSLNYLPRPNFSVQLILFSSSKDNSSGIGEYVRRGASLNSRYQF